MYEPLGIMSTDGIVNVFALIQSPGQEKDGFSFFFLQAARAGFATSRQIWNRCGSS